MRRSNLLPLLAAPLLAGCIIIDGDGDHDSATRLSTTPSDQGRFGTVFGAVIDRDAVEFMVSSNGCTDESYFDVIVDRRSSRTVSIGLTRIEADTCASPSPDGTRVRYRLADLDIPPGATVQIANPVVRR